MSFRRSFLLASLPAAAGLLGWGMGEGDPALFFLAGAVVSLLGSVILVVRFSRLRGESPSRAAGAIGFNSASRLALVAVGLVVLLPAISLVTAVLYLAGFFVSQGLFSAGILAAKE